MDRANTMRQNFLRNDDFYMGVAYLASQRSKDPKTLIGGCVVNEHGLIVAVGHNQMPNDSDGFPWARDNPDIQLNKYLYVCHAGVMTILNKTADVRGGTLYITMFPSCESGKVIVQAGIKEIVYLTNKYKEWKETDAAERMYNMMGITLRANTMRQNFLRNDDFYMGVAYLASQRSKDSKTQVGGCIVNEHGLIVAVGHNQMPNDSDGFPWARDNPDIQLNKYLYVCHAGLMTILNKTADVRGGTLYITMFPSCESGKVIVQAGIKEIVYLTNKYKECTDTDAAEKMYNMMGITLRRFVPSTPEGKIQINFHESITNIMNSFSVVPGNSE